MKRKSALFLILVVIILVVIFCNLQERDHFFWIVQQKLSNGAVINIEMDESWKKRLSFPPHPLTLWSIGGGCHRRDINFSYKGEEYFFRSSDEVVLLNIWDNIFYLVVLIDEDGSKYKYKAKFHFFKYQGGWQEVSSNEFPKEIAIVNSYLSEPYASESDDINKNIEDLKNTRTAKLWLRLEKGIDYYQTRGPKFQVDKQAIFEYKKKYMDPFWSGKDFKEYLPQIKNSKR
ncbi:MAG: hypothetical protein GTN94_03275 [Candidatus Aminicenantes bacterium]|nr:hypothetical protein [Candidatus Aminicenantes bacterium]